MHSSLSQRIINLSGTSQSFSSRAFTEQTCGVRVRHVLQGKPSYWWATDQGCAILTLLIEEFNNPWPESGGMTWAVPQFWSHYNALPVLADLCAWTSMCHAVQYVHLVSSKPLASINKRVCSPQIVTQAQTALKMCLGLSQPAI